MRQACLCCLVTGIVAAMGAAESVGQPVCRPSLALKEAHLSEMQPPTLERKWTAVVSVDASRCAAHSAGYFEIVFRRLKEIGPEIEFREQFVWVSPTVKVGVDFWADEAVERYWIENITPCECGG
jgi:hypothetical protein